MEQKYQTTMTRELGLPGLHQSWGITYADGNRIEEFIRYHEKRLEGLSKRERDDLFDLICASYDDFVLEGHVKSQAIAEFEKFARRAASISPDRLAYWISLTQQANSSEFPSARVLAKYS